MLFKNREQAGWQLGDALKFLKEERPLILGLARGGLVLAAEVAAHLGCDFEVLVARKVGAPHHPEYGIGAVAPGGVKVYEPRALERLFMNEAAFNQLAEKEIEELERRLETYRNGRELPKLEQRTVVIVDDGLATGVTAIAACRYIRSLHPHKLVLAVPVSTQQAKEALEKEVVQFVCLAQPEPFYSVGQWYDDFTQVEDEQVMRLLRQKGSEVRGRLI
jgi:predicted phosphoribosyltransferase